MEEIPTLLRALGTEDRRFLVQREQQREQLRSVVSLELTLLVLSSLALLYAANHRIQRNAIVRLCGAAQSSVRG